MSLEQCVYKCSWESLSQKTRGFTDEPHSFSKPLKPFFVCVCLFFVFESPVSVLQPQGLEPTVQLCSAWLKMLTSRSDNQTRNKSKLHRAAKAFWIIKPLQIEHQYQNFVFTGNRERTMQRNLTLSYEGPNIQSDVSIIKLKVFTHLSCHWTSHPLFWCVMYCLTWFYQHLNYLFILQFALFYVT